MMSNQPYAWRIGDVFTDGASRWEVDAVYREKAVLRSCSSSWATTMPLTFDEWREGGRWQLETQTPVAASYVQVNNSECIYCPKCMRNDIAEMLEKRRGRAWCPRHGDITETFEEESSIRPRLE